MQDNSRNRALAELLQPWDVFDEMIRKRLPTDHGTVAECGLASGQGSSAADLATRRADGTRRTKAQGKVVARRRLLCATQAGAREPRLELRLCECGNALWEDAGHEAQILIEGGRNVTTNDRNSALGYRPPAPVAAFRPAAGALSQARAVI